MPWIGGQCDSGRDLKGLQQEKWPTEEVPAAITTCWQKLKSHRLYRRHPNKTRRERKGRTEETPCPSVPAWCRCYRHVHNQRPRHWALPLATLSEALCSHAYNTGCPGGSAIKNLPAVRETQVQSLAWNICWRRKWQPTAVFFPGESHGQRSLEDQSKGSQRAGHGWATEHSTCVSPSELPGPALTLRPRTKAQDVGKPSSKWGKAGKSDASQPASNPRATRYPLSHSQAWHSNHCDAPPHRS